MNYINKVFQFLICMFVCVTSVYCDVIEIKTDKTDIAIGENLSVDIKLSIPKGSSFIKPGYDCIPGWYIKNIFVQRDKKEHNLYTVSMIITTFKPETEEIPSVAFSYISPDKKEESLYTRPFPVAIKNTKEKDVTDIDRLRDIKSVKKVRIIEKQYIYIFSVFVLYFIYLLMLFLKNKKKELAVLNIIKEKNKMIEKLDRISSGSENLNNLEDKYIAVFSVLKDFFMAEYSVVANKSIDELILVLSDLEMPLSTFKVFSSFLTRIKNINEKDKRVSDDTLNTDINNIKLIISKSLKKD